MAIKSLTFSIILVITLMGCSRMVQNMPAKECNKIFWACDEKSYPYIIRK